MIKIEDAKEIANAFNTKYEQLWNENNTEELAKLYTDDSILVGYETVVGRIEISNLLQNIINAGWSKIQITAVKIHVLESTILIANVYEAFGSGENKGNILNAKSSHVLTLSNNNWQTAMHTTT